MWFSLLYLIRAVSNMFLSPIHQQWIPTKSMHLFNKWRWKLYNQKAFQVLKAKYLNSNKNFQPIPKAKSSSTTWKSILNHRYLIKNSRYLIKNDMYWVVSSRKIINIWHDYLMDDSPLIHSINPNAQILYMEIRKVIDYY